VSGEQDGCPYHPDGDCPLHRFADHAVRAVPRGLDVVVLVSERVQLGKTAHVAMSFRQDGSLDVAALLQHFADDLRRRRLGKKILFEHATLEDTRAALQQAVDNDVRTISISPKAVLRLLNASTMS
jgi:hypothetical protein